MTIQTESISVVEDGKKTSLIYKVLVVLGLMSVIGGSLTGVMTYINAGYTDAFLTNWLSSFLKALVVMPIGFLLMKVISTIIEKWLPNMATIKRNLVIGLVMALIMESILSFTTAANIIGFSSYAMLFSGWLHAFMAALPLGLTIMLIMSMSIKPRVELFLKS